MSEVAIFIVGSLIFAITVYGSVMAGGLALTRAEEHALPTDADVEPIVPAPAGPVSVLSSSASVPPAVPGVPSSDNG